MTLKTIFFILTVLTFVQLQAQDKFGAVHSNYSPTNSVHLNPSSMLDAKTWIDIHIIGAGSYANNNLVAIENQSWINVLRQRQIDENQLLYNTNRNKYHFYNRTDVSALSAVLSQGDHAFGLSFNGFSYADGRRFDNSLVEPLELILTNQDVTNFSDLELANIRVNGSSYGEVKLSYGYTFNKMRSEMLMLGVSVKKIFPIVGGAAKISEANYSLLQNDFVAINRFVGDLMYNQDPAFTLLGGMGIDLGFTYQKMKDRVTTYFPNSPKNGCNPKFYQYKIGLSLLDLGMVKYNENSSEMFAVEVDSLLIGPNEDIENVLNSITTGNEAGAINKPNKMSLPTVFSFQFDYNIWNNTFYLNGTIIQGIPPFTNTFGVRRANSVSITPRLETKWFDVAMPFSLYEYKQPQIGFSMRLYMLTIGTDKLLNIFIPSDLYGADIYAQLKVPLYKNPKCKDRSFNSKKARKKRKNLCDAYW